MPAHTRRSRRATPSFVVISMASLAGAMASSAQAYILGDSYLLPENVLTIDGAIKVANIDSGWVRNDFYHDPGNTNYAAGFCEGCALPRDNNHNNFFVFDISALTAPASTLSFTVFTFSALETWDYHLHDYTGSIAALVSGTGGEAAYKDLADGALYGEGRIGPANNRTFMTFTLSPSAVSDLNHAIASHQTQFAIGGTATALPEPQAIAQMLAGLLGVAAWRRLKARP